MTWRLQLYDQYIKPPNRLRRSVSRDLAQLIETISESTVQRLSRSAPIIHCIFTAVDHQLLIPSSPLITAACGSPPGHRPYESDRQSVCNEAFITRSLVFIYDTQ